MKSRSKSHVKTLIPILALALSACNGVQKAYQGEYTSSDGMHLNLQDRAVTLTRGEVSLRTSGVVSGMKDTFAAVKAQKTGVYVMPPVTSFTAGGVKLPMDPLQSPFGSEFRSWPALTGPSYEYSDRYLEVYAVFPEGAQGETEKLPVPGTSVSQLNAVTVYFLMDLEQKEPVQTLRVAYAPSALFKANQIGFVAKNLSIDSGEGLEQLSFDRSQ